MKYFFNLFCIGCMLCCAGCSDSTPQELRVMSFNIWVGGGKSVAATADVIVKSNADIIGIQESNRRRVNTAAHIADSLGWYSYEREGSPTIVSKYAITDTSANGKGVKIQISKKQFVWMFNIHLMYCPYEPYQLNGIEYCEAPILSTAEEAVASAWKTRASEVEAVIADIKEAQKEGYPVFLTGDFNEPSCLDWTSRAVEAGLCKMAVAWPATKAFQEQSGMKDSYRTFYPDEVKNPGRTWTPLPETEEYTDVLDRIDFVFFWGKAELVNSSIVGEKSSLSDIGFENYPSDHRAVLSLFRISK